MHCGVLECLSERRSGKPRLLRPHLGGRPELQHRSLYRIVYLEGLRQALISFRQLARKPDQHHGVPSVCLYRGIRIRRTPRATDCGLKAQTRIWGYDLSNAQAITRSYAKRRDRHASQCKDPNRQETSQSLSADYTLGKSTYTPDDDVVEAPAGCGTHMAPDGEVNKVLETVVNNILVTNDLDIPAIRVRVMLTTPLESFVMGRTIVLSAAAWWTSSRMKQR